MSHVVGWCQPPVLTLSVVLPGGLLHCNVPLHNAARAAHTWRDSARSTGRDHLLPLPWHLSPFRPPGKITQRFTTSPSLPPDGSQTRASFVLSGVDGRWHSDFLLLRHRSWVPHLSWELQHLPQRLLQVGTFQRSNHTSSAVCLSLFFLIFFFRCTLWLCDVCLGLDQSLIILDCQGLIRSDLISTKQPILFYFGFILSK